MGVPQQHSGRTLASTRKVVSSNPATGTGRKEMVKNVGYENGNIRHVFTHTQGRHNIQHNDTQHNDIHHKRLICDTKPKQYLAEE